VPLDQKAPILFAIRFSDGEVAEGKNQLGPCFEEGSFPSEFVRHPFIVRVEKGDEVVPCRLHTEIPSCARASMSALCNTNTITIAR